MLRICDILVRYGSGSVDQTNGSGNSSVTFKMATKIFFFFEVYFCLMIEESVSDPDPVPYLVLMDPELGGPKTYGSYESGSATQYAQVYFSAKTEIERYTVYRTYSIYPMYLYMYGYVPKQQHWQRKLKLCLEIFQESVAKKIPRSTTIPNTIPATAIPLGVQIAASRSGLSISVPRT
jgi:hypothetical protein